MNREMIYYLKSPSVEGGRWVEKKEQIKVFVMAVADGYAMIRRKGCAPFVVKEKELQELG